MEECDKIEDLKIELEVERKQVSEPKIDSNNKYADTKDEKIKEAIIKDANDDQLEFVNHSEFCDFTPEEMKAVDNLVSLSSLRRFPTIPSLEFIRNFLDCEDCKLYNRPLRIQTLIYCCFINDFSFIEGCLTSNPDLRNLDEKPFDNKDINFDSKDINFDNKDINFDNKEINFDKDQLEIKDQLTLPNVITKKNKCKNKINSKRKSNIAPLICHKCQNVFTTKNGMKYHLKYVHTKENENVVKPFKCPFSDICKRKYKNKNGLFYHLQHHHKNETENMDILVETRNVVNANKINE